MLQNKKANEQEKDIYNATPDKLWKTALASIYFYLCE